MEVKPQRSDDEYIRFKTSGKISKDGQPANREPLEATFGPELYACKVLIDLADCQYIDSTGVEWLLNCHDRGKQAGGAVVWHSASPLASQLLKTMRMDLVLNLASSEEDAKKMAADAAPNAATVPLRAPAPQPPQPPANQPPASQPPQQQPPVPQSGEQTPQAAQAANAVNPSPADPSSPVVEGQPSPAEAGVAQQPAAPSTQPSAPTSATQTVGANGSTDGTVPATSASPSADTPESTGPVQQARENDEAGANPVDVQQPSTPAHQPPGR